MSRPRSGRGASAPAAKPTRGRAAASGGRPGVFVQTPASDIYVAMLGVSLASLLIGAILLALVMNRYEWKTKVSALGTTSVATAVV